ncbi:MAG: hypothetical protein ACP5NQ_05820, partial [Vulcanisaeta sp.]
RINDFIQEASEWVYEISINRIPQLSIESAKLMFIDTIAAALNSLRSNWTRILINNNYSIIERYPMLSIMFDYDSTLLYYGHLGHGIIAPILHYFVNNGNKLSGEGIIEAIVASVEISARIAASLSLSSYRGQMMSPVHSLTTALLLSKMNEEPPSVIRRSLIYALSFIIRPTREGFLTLSKIFTAAISSYFGILAYELAKNSSEDPNIDTLHAFLKSWDAPILIKPLSGLGKRWHINTISVKKYPACSYAQTAIELAIKLSKELSYYEIKQVDKIILKENILTYLMDLGHERFIKGPYTPFTALQFYTPYLISSALIHKNFTIDNYSNTAINDAKVWSLVKKVVIEHYKDYTIKLLSEPLPFGVAFNELSEDLIKKLSIILGISASELETLKSRNYDLDNIDINNTRKYMGIGIEVYLSNGKRISGEEEIIEGFHGTDLNTKFNVTINKLRRGLEPLIADEDEVNNMINTLLNLHKASVNEARSLLNSLITVLQHSGRQE